jgi:hypothetical protein
MPFLGLFLCDLADSATDANPEVSLVDEATSILVDCNPWRSCSSHESPPGVLKRIRLSRPMPDRPPSVRFATQSNRVWISFRRD